VTNYKEERDIMEFLIEDWYTLSNSIALSGAIRDLKSNSLEKFEIGVATPWMAVFENNPNISVVSGTAEKIKSMQDPYLIMQANASAYHLSVQYAETLGRALDVDMVNRKSCGDIHLSSEEKDLSEVESKKLIGDSPYWLLCTACECGTPAKSWVNKRWERIVDKFRGKILFAQVSAPRDSYGRDDLTDDFNAHIPGTIDLRGKLDVRQLIRLTYRAEGVLTVPTFAMGLAAAVPMPKDSTRATRPCVIIGGGRESEKWVSISNQQYISLSGALACNRSGGCWQESLEEGHNRACSHVVKRDGQRVPYCMSLITVNDVVRRMSYFLAGDPKTC